MPLKKKILLGCVVLLVAIQFFPARRNVTVGRGPNDLAALHPAPVDVQALLEKACYDCHSNHTRYPWYARIQPVGWWLASHINDGKRHLNFSEFGAYDPTHAPRKLRQAAKQIEEGEMPLGSYTLIHRDARLGPADAKLLADWLKDLAAQLAAAAPAQKP